MQVSPIAQMIVQNLICNLLNNQAVLLKRLLEKETILTDKNILKVSCRQDIQNV